MDLKTILPAIGYIGIFIVIFAESGLLVGFFLPGDSLLFTAGFLASQGIFNITWLCVLCFIAAVVGDSVGYTFGRRVGRKLFHKKDSLFFSKENLEKAEAFYEKNGKKTIVLARFMPVIRTFAPIVAGIGEMHYTTFIVYNVVGGFIWSVGLTVAGYFLGRTIPNVDHYLLPIIGLIVVISVAPTAYHILKDQKTRDHLLSTLKKTFKI